MIPTARNAMIAAAIMLVVVGLLGYEIVSTRPVRNAVRAYADLIAAADMPGLSETARIEAVRPYFSSRRLAEGPIRVANEGGIEGLPRAMGKNFQAWREGDEVWLCPTGRTGVVHRLVKEEGRWKLDGLVGFLRGPGELIAAPEAEPR